MPRRQYADGETVTCRKCFAVVGSSAELSVHTRVWHQASASCVVFGKDNVPHNHIVERIDGVLKCPQCTYVSRDPKLLRQHTKLCKHAPSQPSQSVRLYTPAETLLEVGLEYNTTVGLVICSICRYALSQGYKQVSLHFKRVHDTTVSTQLLAKKFEPLDFATDKYLRKYTQPSQTLLEPVDGIEIKPGMSCLQCAYFCPLKDTMVKHLKFEHRGATINRDSTRCMVQSLYAGSKTKYFGVLGGNNQYNINIGDQRDAVDQAVATFTEAHSQLAPADDRLVSPFLRRMKWHEVIRAHCTDNVGKLMASVAFDANAELVKLVFPVICRYWGVAQDLIGTREYLFERIFSSTGHEIVPASKLNRIQTSGTEYCRAMTSLLFMVDIHAKQNLLISNDLDCGSLSAKLSKLLQSCSDAVETKSSGVFREVDVTVDHLHLLDQVLEAVFRIDLEDEHSPSEFCAFPTHRYVVCSAISGAQQDDSGYVQFKQPGQVTRVVAMLKCWARLAALMNLHQQSWGVEATVRNMATRARAESLSFYLKSGNRTPFNLLQEVMSFGSSIAMAPEQRRLPQIAWLGSNHEALLVEGHQITLNTLSDLRKQLASRFGRVLRENVLLGYDILSIRELLESPTQVFYDDYSNYSCGYSFLEDDRNPWKAMRMDLVKYLLHVHSSTFISKVECGKITFGLATLTGWCNQVDKLSKLLAPLVHITSGQPSRAAELSATTLRNTVSGERSVYMLNREVMFVQRYHKGVSISGQHRLISRFLPHELTLDFIIYIALVRPAQEFFSAQLRLGRLGVENREKGNGLFYYLFSTVGQGRLNGKGCRAAVNAAFLDCGTQLSVKSYRHVSIAFMEKHIKSTRSDQVMFDFQAAHAPATASTLYSRSTRDPYFMSRDDLAEFQSCSHQWHQLLGVDRGNSVVLADSMSISVTPGSDLPMSTNSTGNPEAQGTLPLDRPELLHKPTYTHMNVTEATNCLLPEHFASARRQLRDFLQRPDANFRSIEQCISTTLILQSVENLLVVLATNGGKSLLYQLSAYCDANRVVVVVVPLVALLLDSIRKTRELGIQCSAYDRSMSPFVALPSILFVGVDYLEQQTFRHFLSSLAEQDKISRIFFDEAHLALTSIDYRRCMASVYILSSIPVQKTLLTATLPPSWEHDLMVSFGFSFATVRTPTIRPSICYEVKEVMSLVEMMKMCLTIFKIRMEHPSKGIIFALTRPKVDEVAAYLASRTGDLIAKYHSGMTLEERKENLATWKSPKCTYIVATCGLGQGVDYPNVRTVIHFGLAHSLIDYAQETGRAARDEKLAHCITIYCETYYNRFSGSLTMLSHTMKRELQGLTQFRAFALEKSRCRRQQLQGVMDGNSLPCTIDHRNTLCDVCSGTMSMENGDCLLGNVSGGIKAQSLAAKALLVDDTKIYLLLQQILFNDTSAHCTICWVSNPSEYSYHLVGSCPIQAARCLRCLDDQHTVRTCTIALQFGFRCRSCYMCGVPLDNLLGRNSLHFGSSAGSSCQTRLRGKMIPGVWTFFEACKARKSSPGGLEKQISLMTREDFSKWLVEVPSGRAFTNLCILWSYVVKLYSS